MARMTSMAALAAAIVLVTAGAAYAVPEVINVTMTQRPGNVRIVDITYELTGEAAVVTLGIETNGIALPDNAVTRLSGDVCKVVELGTNKSIVWNAGADWPEHSSPNARAKVTAWATNTPPLYMVVDVSGGVAASSCPVTYHVSAAALPEGGLSNELYRTTRLVMRRVRTQVSGTTENGVFMMGSPGSEASRTAASETWHQVTLTNDFYVGIYGVTQSQWQQVIGDRFNRPSNFNNADFWMMRPVEKVSYEDIRGTLAQGGGEWPTNGNVYASSFMGRLRARTGLATFDLLTDAQREYACRAGTSGALNDGTAVVGSYLPNAWGLYDMHGNVWEWCLDWYVADLTAASVTDPKGADSGSYRVGRGGSWNYAASLCRSASRYNNTPSYRNNMIGFRLVRTLP